MAITTKNRILDKYRTQSGFVAVAELSNNSVLEWEVPVQMDAFWEQVQQGKGSIENGRIKKIKEVCTVTELEGKYYIHFGLRGDNGNRKYPVGDTEFVVFYNTLAEYTQRLLDCTEWQALVTETEKT